MPPVLSEISSGLDLIVRQIFRIIEGDACDPARARNVRRRPVQVACRLEAENLLLRHQPIIPMRRAPPRLRLLGSVPL